MWRDLEKNTLFGELDPRSRSLDDLEIRQNMKICLFLKDYLQYSLGTFTI